MAWQVKALSDKPENACVCSHKPTKYKWAYVRAYITSNDKFLALKQHFTGTFSDFLKGSPFGDWQKDKRQFPREEVESDSFSSWDKWASPCWRKVIGYGSQSHSFLMGLWFLESRAAVFILMLVASSGFMAHSGC